MAENGTVAYVVEKPKCDIHKRNGNSGVEAEYDFRMYTGQWAYGCEACWKDNRMYPDLGVGKGQKLELHTSEGESDPAGQS